MLLTEIESITFEKTFEQFSFTVPLFFMDNFFPGSEYLATSSSWFKVYCNWVMLRDDVFRLPLALVI